MKPRPIEFRFEQGDNIHSIKPYIFKSNYEGVDIFLTVGLRESIPDAERLLEEQEQVKYSSNDAGWTIICNDRVVLYCDRSELTGWGLYGIPRYHTQFSAISGIVEFRGDPKKLPTTTTKRGLNFSSATYQKVLARMQEGLRLFVDFTNKWKSKEGEARKIISLVPSITFTELRDESDNLSFNKTRRGIEGMQYKPTLPMPEKDSPDVRISYIRQRSEVIELAEALDLDFEEIREKDIPKNVGIKSFEFAFNKLVEKNNN